MKSQGTQHEHELEQELLSLACESLYVGGQINGQNTIKDVSNFVI